MMTPAFDANGVQIYLGDCREVLRQLPSESVHCCVTSPPYWGLRDYGLPPSIWPSPQSQGVVRCNNGDHLWGESIPGSNRGGSGTPTDKNNRGENYGRDHERGQWCQLCGAWRGCFGLEPTPQLYIQHARQVFAEVRRVLRSDGTLWLNMGDSYATGTTSDRSPTATGKHGYWENPAINKRIDGREIGLKPKDLCGIPWALATALRDPHYAGRIASELDRVWLAAMIDAEGCMFIHKRKEGQHNGQGYFRQNASFGSGLEVANCSEAVVLRCQQITGIGSICTQGPDQNGRRKQKIYRWNVRNNECRWILEEVYPYLVAKQQQARLAIGCPSSGEKAKAAHAALIGLHNGIASDVDFPAPQSLYQPGWWLRQDIIWSKANPMPESVTDRCTKSHEYIFLLSKSERYYYNQEAIREPWSCDRDDMREKGVRTGTAYLQQGPVASNHAPGKKINKPRGWASGDDHTAVGWATAERQGATEPRYDNDYESASGRNKRSVWSIATAPFPEAHFATFPQELIKPCILAGCPEGGTVLDPFMGSGTTGLVARSLHSKAIGIELNPEYIEIAKRRLSQQVLDFASAEPTQ